MPGPRAPCRLCLRRSSKNSNVFDTLCHKQKLHIVIHQLFSFWIKPTDVSIVVCLKCCKLLKEFYSFYNTVKKTQIRLLNKNTTVTDYNDTPADDNLVANILIENTAVFIKDSQCTDDIESKIKDDVIESCSYKNEMIDDDNKMKYFNNELGIKYETADNHDKNSSDELLDNYNLMTDNDSFGDIDDEQFDDTTYSKKNTLSKSSKNEDAEINPSAMDMQDDSTVDFIENLQDDLSFNNFPKEIIRNGNLTVKGPLLDKLIRKFYNIHCELCTAKTKFESLSEMFKHYDVEHKTKGYITCCNTRLYHRQRINMHMARHLQPSAFQCPICKKDLHHKKTLQLHLQTHLPESERSYKCDKCDRRYSYLSGLRTHKMTHIPAEQRLSYNCEFCKKSFTSAPSYYNHVSAMHTSGKYLCSDCGRGFQTKTSLSYHMQTHDPNGDNKVQCKHCGFICKNQLTLKIHIKRHTVDPIQCTLCNYTAHRTQQLNSHMKVKHSDAKPYTCNVCSKQFKLNCVLKTHMAQHTGERKFSCSYCPKTFASSGNYYSHRKRMHGEHLVNDINAKTKIILNEDNNVIEKQSEPTNEPHVMEFIRKQINQLKSKKREKVDVN